MIALLHVLSGILLSICIITFFYQKNVIVTTELFVTIKSRYPRYLVLILILPLTAVCLFAIVLGIVSYSMIIYCIFLAIFISLYVPVSPSLIRHFKTVSDMRSPKFRYLVTSAVRMRIISVGLLYTFLIFYVTFKTLSNGQIS